MVAKINYAPKEASMRAFHDATATVDEPNDARMNFRTKAHIKKAIQRAAALAGVDDTSFAMAAAYQSAMETIAAHERTHLAAVAHEAFFGALDNPPAPSARLKDAFKRHRETVVSK
jgi:uncharacterized protein (DUF1778 family)